MQLKLEGMFTVFTLLSVQYREIIVINCVLLSIFTYYALINLKMIRN
jgi:hypothetical protein